MNLSHESPAFFQNPDTIAEINNTNLIAPIKRYQEQIARGLVVREKNTAHATAFGGLVVKTLPLKNLEKFAGTDLSEEIKLRAAEDECQQFYRLHFLPSGSYFAKNPGEALQTLAVGVCDLQDFSQWLEVRRTLANDKLAHRLILGASAYELGHAIRKHLPVFEVYDESKPLNKSIPLERALMMLEMSSAFYAGPSTWVLLGAFAPEFLLESRKLSKYHKQVMNLVRRRFPELRNLDDLNVELELRRLAVLRAGGITR